MATPRTGAATFFTDWGITGYWAAGSSSKKRKTKGELAMSFYDTEGPKSIRLEVHMN